LRYGDLGDTFAIHRARFLLKRDFASAWTVPWSDSIFLRIGDAAISRLSIAASGGQLKGMLIEDTGLVFSPQQTSSREARARLRDRRFAMHEVDLCDTRDCHRQSTRM
jgi:hypothetical protein